MLHVTNGDVAAELILRSGVRGDVLPWRDVLHEGPVPDGQALSQMSDVRAAFIAQSLGGSRDDIRADFQARDERLVQSVMDDEVVLWFEADLYDQLQILQVLDWFWGQPARPPVSLICIGEFPGMERFDGLGQLSSTQLSGLFSTRTPVSEAQLALARTAWEAVTAPTPDLLNQRMRMSSQVTPFMVPALVRLLEHYPSSYNGLDRTDHQALQIIDEGGRSFPEIFPAFQRREERPFLGDLTLWSRIVALSTGVRPPLHLTGVSDVLDPGNLCSPDVHCELTDFGRACLAGQVDYWTENAVDRWVGGTHVTSDSPWRWDRNSGNVRKFPTV